MVDILVEKIDEVFNVVYSEDRGVLQELSEFFSFFAKNYEFSPKYKNRVWDGKIRLYSTLTGKLYGGLLKHLEFFCQERGYNLKKLGDLAKPAENVDFDYDEFIKSLDLVHTPYETQKVAICSAIKDKKRLFLSPVNSGKSLIIYSLFRYLLPRANGKILIVVPTVSLVHQMYSDFHDYNPNYDIEPHIHKIYAGQEKSVDKQVFLTTWQSLQNQPKKYFKQFGAVIVDECHGAKADELKKILEHCDGAEYRIGTTGTLDGMTVNKLTIEGLTGPTLEVTTQKHLIDAGISSNINIDCFVINYPLAECEANKKLTYQEEMKYVVNSEPRNRLIANICKTIPKDENVIILTQFINHIELIKKAIIASGCTKEIIVFAGTVESTQREIIRKSIDGKNGIIMIATYGAASTGLNIKNLQWMITASSSKSQIRVIQTIGRILRKDGKENLVKLIDLVDNMKYKSHLNYLMKHFVERVKIYTKEKYPYKIKKINI